jgi:hypothetical protein
MASDEGLMTTIAEYQFRRDLALHRLYAAEDAHKRIRGASTDEQREVLARVRADYWKCERELKKAQEVKW